MPLGVRRAARSGGSAWREIGEHARAGRRSARACSRGRMDDLAPEGEPDAARARLELLRRERRVDHRLDALARASAPPRSRADDAAREPRGEAAERRLEQPVLVVEIVRDQPRRDAVPAGRSGRAWWRRSPLGERVDRRLDQLPPTKILAFDPAQAIHSGTLGLIERPINSAIGTAARLTTTT